LLEAGASFSLSGACRRITVELLAGYPYAQVFAPKGSDCVALEPMTAPTNALVSGRGLHLVSPGQEFQATFRIRVESEADAISRWTDGCGAFQPPHEPEGGRYRK
jgi:aldose 1-epimerase